MTSEPTPTKFGTFTGVFTPTLLTILGVIMYVRLPWVVGNAGLLGAFAVMGLAMGITACTGLSLSSIATNTRLGAGGPYALITRSLGLEVGGSIGVPLYLSRPLSIAMYVFGFREGWLWIFPTHPPLLVDLCVFVVVFGLAALPKVAAAGIAVIAANLTYTVAMVAVVVTDVWTLTTAGAILTLATGVYTLAFAELQYIGLRRMRRNSASTACAGAAG